jgi:hypothetical protein
VVVRAPDRFPNLAAQPRIESPIGDPLPAAIMHCDGPLPLRGDVGNLEKIPIWLRLRVPRSVNDRCRRRFHAHDALVPSTAPVTLRIGLCHDRERGNEKPQMK